MFCVIGTSVDMLALSKLTPPPAYLNPSAPEILANPGRFQGSPSCQLHGDHKGLANGDSQRPDKGDGDRTGDFDWDTFHVTIGLEGGAEKVITEGARPGNLTEADCKWALEMSIEYVTLGLETINWTAADSRPYSLS